MVVKSQIKFIKSLQQKKHRMENSLFVAEGVKTVIELLASRFKADCIYTTDAGLFTSLPVKYEVISESDLRKISGLKAPNKVLGVFHMRRPAPLDFKDWILVLDAVKDPGNLGTIIRLCDWFGILHLVCSKDTVDCYNPKVLQATMGSIGRVNIVYTDIQELLQQAASAVYGAYMDGTPVYEMEWPSSGLLVMGNEAHGISKDLEGVIEKKVGIPQFGEATTESLNVATATAILLSELRRKRVSTTQR